MQANALARMAVIHSRTWNTKQTVDIDFALQAESHLTRGELQKASEAIQQCLTSCQTVGEKFRIANAREMLARLYMIEGQREDAITEACAGHRHRSYPGISPYY